MNNEEMMTVPMLTINEHPEDYVFTFELPGVDKGDVDLHAENRSLTLKTHATYQNPAGFKLVNAEFVRTNYATSVDLPETADPATISAKLENGLLTVTVKKRPETQARAIAIG